MLTAVARTTLLVDDIKRSCLFSLWVVLYSKLGALESW